MIALETFAQNFDDGDQGILMRRQSETFWEWLCG